MAEKLEIQVLRPRSAAAVLALEPQLPAAEDVLSFALYCEEDATFIVAKAQLENAADREAWEREAAALEEETRQSMAALAEIATEIKEPS